MGNKREYGSGGLDQLPNGKWRGRVRTPDGRRVTVTRWLHSFEAHGVSALTPGKSPGRPPKADADFQAALIEAVEQNPRDLGPKQPVSGQALLIVERHRCDG